MSTAWPSELGTEWWDSFDVEEDWQDEGCRGAEEQVYVQLCPLLYKGGFVQDSVILCSALYLLVL